MGKVTLKFQGHKEPIEAKLAELHLEQRASAQLTESCTKRIWDASCSKTAAPHIKGELPSQKVLLAKPRVIPPCPFSPQRPPRHAQGLAVLCGAQEANPRSLRKCRGSRNAPSKSPREINNMEWLLCFFSQPPNFPVAPLKISSGIPKPSSAEELSSSA